MKLLRFKRPERISQDDLFSQLFALAERRYPALMQNTDPLAGLTVEELDAQLAETLAELAAFHAANPGAVLTPEDAALERELQKVLAEIARLDPGFALRVNLPRDIAAPQTDDVPVVEPVEEKEEPERPAEHAAEHAKTAVKPGYPYQHMDDGVLRPMTDAEAEKALRRYRARLEEERYNSNPLTWWNR